MRDDYAIALGARLRRVRTHRGLSLGAVERESAGRWKAAVVGSYERGDRSVSVSTLSALAEFYGVGVEEILPDATTRNAASRSPRLVIDLRVVAELPAGQVGPLARFAAAIRQQRGDYDNDYLTIRSEDLRSLAVLYGMRPEQLADVLMGWGILRPDVAAVAVDSVANGDPRRPPGVPEPH